MVIPQMGVFMPKIACAFDVSRFPFDRQTCFIVIKSKSSFAKSVWSQVKLSGKKTFQTGSKFPIIVFTEAGRTHSRILPKIHSRESPNSKQKGAKVETKSRVGLRIKKKHDCSYQGEALIISTAYQGL